MNQRPPALPSSSRRLLSGWLMCALLFTQGLGLWHGIVHVHGPAAAAAPAHAEAALDHGGLAHGFEHHHEASDCQLFDQVSHADAVHPAPALVPHAATASGCATAARQPDIAAQAAGFLARGPPARV